MSSGRVPEDKYLWLENLNNPRVLEWVKERNRKLREFLGDLPGKLYPRVLKYYEIPYVLTAYPAREGFIVLKKNPRSYSIELYSYDGEFIETIVDSKNISRDAIIHAIYPSETGRILAYYYSIGGQDVGELVVIETSTKETIDKIEGSVSNIVWLKGEEEYYYARFYRNEKTPDGVEPPAERIFHRRISGGEELVFGEGFNTNYMMYMHPTYSEEALMITVHYGWAKSKIYGGPLRDPGKWELVFDGGDYIVESVDYYGGKPYIIYYDGNGLGRILEASNNKVREIVGEDKKYPLENARIFKGMIISSYLVEASNRLRIYDLEGRLVKEIVFDKPGSVNWLVIRGDKLLYKYESFDTPYTLRLLENPLGEPKTLLEHRIPLDIEVRDEWATSSDGTRIHFFTVKPRRGKEKKMVLVRGYGGFGVSLKPRFIPMIYPLLEDGGLFVQANLRGGGEYGEKWHHAGMKENKQNVFEDYKAVLRLLKEKGYKTIAWGASNGGLLVAATITQNPELVDVALIGYPVIDMMRFHKLYIGRLWTTEYGDPDNPRDREYLLKYSPYHNIDPSKKYPPTLVYTGLHDDRVHPGHAFKFAARLEEIGAPVYLRVEEQSGHSGANPETKARETTDLIAFAYKNLGVKL